MLLLLHFLSKQMILAELTGNAIESERWKSVTVLCSTSVKKKVPKKLQSVAFACSHPSVSIGSRKDCSSPKERQWNGMSFCKRTSCPINCYTGPETVAVVEENSITSTCCQSS